VLTKSNYKEPNILPRYVKDSDARYDYTNDYHISKELIQYLIVSEQSL